LSSLDKLISQDESAPEKPNVVLALRKIGANKDLRIFLTALCRYSKSDWAGMIRTAKILYQVFQSSILIKQDSAMLDEISKVPHIAAFFRRLNEEDV
jgi:hypothetical protein